MYKYLQKMFYQ
ncbi:Uncharacterised protein g1601 [Pycnogonum litorale]